MKCCDKPDIWYDSDKNQDFCKHCKTRWVIKEYTKRIKMKEGVKQ